MFIAVTLLCSCLFIAATIIIWRQAKIISQTRHHLLRQIHINDIYMNRFIALSSVHIEKINHIARLTQRKISAGRTDELAEMIASGRLVDDCTHDFYNILDSTFLSLYPDFIEKINSLLLPDRQLASPPPGQLLSVDLRISACLCLGITESARIAQLLNYSPNTIYAYRNRLRNRAVNRQTFEADLMKISPTATHQG